ncbi:hypothetical protein [Aureimonas ureilytica]|uniref:hypothetical protein n=1 Tax=Aureimonas ureilytica TaxID=401562 RepID=UPI00128F5F93|nr:hypothetical protein [Aureimonas ureilytica]
MTVADARIGQIGAEHVHFSGTDTNIVPEGENGAVANTTVFGEDPPLDGITGNGFYTAPDHLSHVSPVDNASNYSKVLTLPYTLPQITMSDCKLKLQADIVGTVPIAASGVDATDGPAEHRPHAYSQ